MAQRLFFGLRVVRTGELVGFDVSSNDGGEFCNSVQYTLETEGECPVWLVDNQLTAEYVRRNSAAWYSAGYSTPSHSFRAEELEVVQFNLGVQSVTPLAYPTLEEYVRFRYADDPLHRAHFLNLARRGDLNLSLSNLQEYFRLIGEQTNV